MVCKVFCLFIAHHHSHPGSMFFTSVHLKIAGLLVPRFQCDKKFLLISHLFYLLIFPQSLYHLQTSSLIYMFHSFTKILNHSAKIWDLKDTVEINCLDKDSVFTFTFSHLLIIHYLFNHLFLFYLFIV